jgi:ABC-type multidrug transport system fused ATPase/permease subunit
MIDLLASGLSAYQAHRQHSVGQKTEDEQHEEEMCLAREQFDRELKTTRRTYLLSTFADIETYFQELNENLISSSRDAERDMVDQRNQQFQTIFLADTIMLAALLNILFQGILPDTIANYFYILFSTAIAAGLACLVINVAICMIITRRVTSFMYHRSDNNVHHVKDAMERTKNMMGEIRSRSERVPVAMPTSVPSSFAMAETVTLDAAQHLQSTLIRRQISTMGEKEVEREWEQHEKVVYDYLDNRRELHDRLQQQSKLTFEEYWRDHCSRLATWATLLFYSGTAFMLLATMIFVWVSNIYDYHSPVAAAVAVATIGLALFMGLAMTIYLRKFDPINSKLQAQQEQVEDNGSSTFDASGEGSIRPSMSAGSLNVHIY